jgi:hypothetical protein
VIRGLPILIRLDDRRLRHTKFGSLLPNNGFGHVNQPAPFSTNEEMVGRTPAVGTVRKHWTTSGGDVAEFARASA